MRAACYSKTGPAHEVMELIELNDPLPRRGEVRVRIECSGVNPADVKRRAGEQCRRLEFPIIIPHSDGAGIIDAVGAGVLPSRVGQRVWVWNAQWGRPFGTAAEYTVVPAEQAVVLPDEISYEAGAGLGVPALTAHYALSFLECGDGRVVFISGGSGVIGHLAIQLAKARGATVITSVSSEEKRAFAEAAGADLVVNYKTEDIVEAVSNFTNGEYVSDVLEVDLNANLAAILRMCSPCPRIVVYGSASNMSPPLPVLPLQLLNASIRFISGSEQPGPARALAIAEICARLSAGRLRVLTAGSFPLDRIADAHHCVESGDVIGKTVVRPQC